MKRRFRYDRATDRMVEIPLYDDPDDLHMVRGDIPAFWSPVDGTIVEGRRAYAEHNKRNHVQPFEQGSEKTTPQGRSQEDRKALREFLWEKTDRVMRGHKAQD